MQDKVVLRSYNRINSIEKKIYTIQNFKLPMSVNLNAAGYFFIVVLIIVFISQIFPFLESVPPILKYILSPYFIAQYMRQKKLDGKKPWKYFIDYVIFYLNRNNEYERFKRVKIPRKIKFNNPKFKEG